MKEQSLHILTFVKYKLLKALSVIATFLSPIGFIMILIGVAIIVDTIMGRWAAKHVARRDGKDVRLFVTSEKTRKGMTVKMLVYNLIIITLFVLDKYIMNDFVMYLFENFPIDFVITKAVGIILILVEYDSMDEKYYIVYGVRIGEKMKKIVRKVKSTTKSLKEFSDKIKD
jgi:hypothetical protein